MAKTNSLFVLVALHAFFAGEFVAFGQVVNVTTTTLAAAVTTQPPAATTQPPAATTQPPAATTMPPAATTQAPAATTMPPAASTQAPAMGNGTAPPTKTTPDPCAPEQGGPALVVSLLSTLGLLAAAFVLSVPFCSI